jgi:hypothetical protein
MVAQNVSLPSTADVVAATGGHPGNPWREQRLLFLYQVPSGVESPVAPTADLRPLPAAA